MMRAIVTGFLVSDPVKRVTKAGGDYATASMRDGAHLVGLTAFHEELVGQLLKLKRGDSLAAAGAFEPTTWSDSKTGAERHGFRLTMSSLITLDETEVPR